MRIFFTLCLVLLLQVLPAQNTSPEKVCDLFLSAISVQQGEKINWDRLRELFTEDAKFRSVSENGAQTLNFDQFKEKSRYEAMGFEEKALKRKLTVFGNMASISEQFEAKISSQGVQFQGINMYHLIKIQDDWKIANVMFQLADKDLPLPSEW